jgi:hypothetical protein
VTKRASRSLEEAPTLESLPLNNKTDEIREQIILAMFEELLTLKKEIRVHLREESKK